MSEVRTERTHGVKERLTGSDRAALVAIRHTAGYEVLLDVMERVCIEQETNLINLPASSEREVLAEHKMSKAAWQIFTRMQNTVEVEIAYHQGILEDKLQKQQDVDNFDPQQDMLSPFGSTHTGLVEDE